MPRPESSFERFFFLPRLGRSVCLRPFSAVCGFNEAFWGPFGSSKKEES
jgi:hypothetical protein